MLTIDTIKPEGLNGVGHEDYIVDVDINDDGWFYIKQDMDWVCLPTQYVGDLINALLKLQGRSEVVADLREALESIVDDFEFHQSQGTPIDRSAAYAETARKALRTEVSDGN